MARVLKNPGDEFTSSSGDHYVVQRILLEGSVISSADVVINGSYPDPEDLIDDEYKDWVETG